MHGCTTQAQSVKPVMGPIPTLDEDASFPIGLERSGIEPTVGTLVLSSFNGLVSADGHKASQRGSRRAIGPGLILFRPLQVKPILDNHTYMPRVSPPFNQQAASVRSSNENTEDSLLST